jgi:hypothetical protein
MTVPSILDLYFDRIIPEPNSGCWIWEGSISKSNGSSGYGVVKISGQQIRAHRLSYELSCEKIPDGLMVLHRCDNSLCVNPYHLETGDAKKNIQDASSRGRLPKGSRHGRARFKEDEVREIRSASRHTKGWNKEMAEKYGVPVNTIHEIRQRRTWRAI